MTTHPSPSGHFAARSAAKAPPHLRRHRKKVLGLGAISLLFIIGVPVIKSRTTTADTAVVAAPKVLSVETLTVEAVDS